MSQQAMACAPTPVLIVGAGISGLLLAQQLRKLNIPFQIFERDHDFMTRGLGWGLTLHWSLPSLYECLPEDLLNALPKIYVNSAEVERGATSAFPFFDLSTGTLKSSTPTPSGSRRVRVTRQKLRMLLATGIEVQVRSGQGEDSLQYTC
jgi:2-polyprenyl-6-methoxyphenol hydroxylase-like FAD-dependent oxidoreductase